MSYDEHLISMAGGDGELGLNATERVAEWARQWRLNPNIDKSGTIYNVWFDPEASAVELNLNDIETLLALVREQQAKLDRVEAQLDEWASFKPFPDAEDTQRWYSLGKRHAADAIRAAITATEAGK